MYMVLQAVVQREIAVVEAAVVPVGVGEGLCK
jgi:hypothetical protein